MSSASALTHLLVPQGPRKIPAAAVNSLLSEADGAAVNSPHPSPPPPDSAAMDWDDLLAYSTIKLVRVQDRRLGILHYFFTLVILVYVVVYVQLIQKEYMQLEVPEGTVRLGLFAPRECPDGQTGAACRQFRQEQTELPYCQLFADPVPPGYLMPDPFQCRYDDDSFAVWPPVEQRGFFASTRITEREQEPPAGCTDGGADGPRPQAACFDWETTGEVTYYVAQIESFTAFIDHTMTASRLDLSYSWVREHTRAT